MQNYDVRGTKTWQHVFHLNAGTLKSEMQSEVEEEES
jgi:hypothetical protein